VKFLAFFKVHTVLSAGVGKKKTHLFLVVVQEPFLWKLQTL